MPDDLQKVSLAPAENVEIAGMRIALQRLLHENRKGAESFSHIRVARRQPHPNAARKSDHLSGSFARPDLRSPASAPITLARVVSSGEPSIVIRTLAPKAIVIAARGETGVGAGSGAMGATVTGTKAGRPSCEAANCCRQRYRRLRSMPACLATSVALAPGSISAATHASFSERDHRRRLSTDVMTSIRFMALWLSLVLATLSCSASLPSQGGEFRTDTL